MHKLNSDFITDPSKHEISTTIEDKDIVSFYSREDYNEISWIEGKSQIKYDQNLRQ